MLIYFCIVFVDVVNFVDVFGIKEDMFCKSGFFCINMSYNFDIVNGWYVMC